MTALEKILYLKFSPGIGTVKAVKTIRENRLDTIDFSNEKIQEKVQREISLIEQKGVKTVTLLDENYPTLLKEIYDPPPMLYYLGDLNTKQSLSLAVVGTRRPSQYGKRVTEHLCQDLVFNNVEIVSGLALGIDALAHASALRKEGRTVAVLGCGLDVNYPASNQKLKEAIIDRGGCILSEFPMGEPGRAGNFPIRNRVISGLSRGVLVTEATTDSGSLITAKRALEQNRNLYSVPGSIFLDSFSGNNLILRRGAVLVRSAKDILDDFNALFPQASMKTTQTKEAPLQKEVELSGFLTEEERLIYEFMNEPCNLDVLISKTGFAAPKTLGLITQLIIKGMAEEKGGFYYQS